MAKITVTGIEQLIAAHDRNTPDGPWDECDGCHVGYLRAALAEIVGLDAALTEIHVWSHHAYQRTGDAPMRRIVERAWRALAYLSRAGIPDDVTPAVARAEAQVRAVEALIDPESTMSSGPMGTGPRYFSERDIRAALSEPEYRAARRP